MTYDDFLFYLPGFASVPLVVAGMLAMWLAWKLIKRRKKQDLKDLSVLSSPERNKGIDKTPRIG